MRPTFDMNTSTETVDGIGPGELLRPTLFTVTAADTARVTAYVMLATLLGTYSLDQATGTDVETIFDPLTSDAERGAIVANVILAVPDVTGLESEPLVELVDDGQRVNIQVTATVGDQTFSIGLVAP